jgi:molybdate transport system ATP-binding protein
MAVQMTNAKTGELQRKAPSASLFVDVRATLKDGSDARFDLAVTLNAPPGIAVLFGPSGAGKTSVLDCVAGLLRPDAGRIRIGADALYDSDARTDIPVQRRRVGYVFQDLALFPHLSVRKNVEYGINALSDAERQSETLAILDAFRIAHLQHRKPGDISGGERQRVALARTLVTNPRALLLDEPLSALDAQTKSRIMDDLRGWNDRHRIPILYVTHSREEVFSLAERVAVLDKGSVLAQGSPYEILERPEYELTAELSGFENIFDAAVVERHEYRGTMTCAAGQVHLEVPYSRRVTIDQANDSDSGVDEPKVRIGIRAGDILLAIVRPEGISARNIVPGKIVSLTRRDMMAVAQVDCGVLFEVHLTPHAQESLSLRVGSDVWLVIKTHSCHLLQRT